MDLASILKSAPVGAEISGPELPSRPVGDGEAFAEALRTARQKISGRRELVGSVLRSKNLTSKNITAGRLDGSASFQRLSRGIAQAAPAETADSPFSFKSGWAGLAEMVELAETAAAPDPRRAALPSAYKKQLGVGLLVQGRSGLSADSMLAGASLMNSRSSAEALREVFASLGAGREHLKLDRAALDDLGQVLASSGLEAEEIDGFISGIAAGGLGVEEIYARLEKLDLAESPRRGLAVTAESLPALAQFLGNLGVAPEAVDNLTANLQPGDRITAADLRPLLTAEDGAPLAPCLSETDARNLEAMLKSMGVGQDDLGRLSALMGKNEGRTTPGQVLDFLEGLENAPAKTITGQELKLVKNILDNISRERELVKTPVFEETLTKLQALGDPEIDEDFARMSPALQALRGGVSGLNRETAFGGQGDHSGQNSPNGQGGGQGQSGWSGRDDGRDSREHFRRVMSAAHNEAAPAAAAETAEIAQSYGGHENLARQISQKIAYSHRRGLHRLKMNLNPADLGRLDIELKVQGDRLVAHIRAESRETYEALGGEIESLKTALAESGLEISKLTLAFDDRETGNAEFADLGSLKARTEENKPSGENASEARQGAVHRVI